MAGAKRGGKGEGKEDNYSRARRARAEGGKRKVVPLPSLSRSALANNSPPSPPLSAQATFQPQATFQRRLIKSTLLNDPHS